MLKIKAILNVFSCLSLSQYFDLNDYFGLNLNMLLESNIKYDFPFIGV
jgi:hypothetical protein